MGIMFHGGPEDGKSFPGPPDSAPTNHADAVDGLLEAANAALNAPGMTEADKLIVEQIKSLGQKLKAQFEKEQQAAMGGGPATQFLKRASGGV